MFLQLDGCPAHYSINIRNHINGTVRESWIRRGSLFPWPARSPDSTFLDFHLWGRLKDIVFQNPPTTRMDMENRIRNSIRQKSRLRLYRLRKDWNNVWNITEGNLNTNGIIIFSKSIIIRTTTLFKREIAYKYENVWFKVTALNTLTFLLSILEKSLCFTSMVYYLPFYR